MRKNYIPNKWRFINMDAVIIYNTGGAEKLLDQLTFKNVWISLLGWLKNFSVSICQ